MGKQKIIDLVKREEQQTVRWQMKVKNIFMIFKAACLQTHSDNICYLIPKLQFLFDDDDDTYLYINVYMKI